jgi:hypothetical protein
MVHPRPLLAGCHSFPIRRVLPAGYSSGRLTSVLVNLCLIEKEGKNKKTTTDLFRVCSSYWPSVMYVGAALTGDLRRSLGRGIVCNTIDVSLGRKARV